MSAAVGDAAEERDRDSEDAQPWWTPKGEGREREPHSQDAKQDADKGLEGQDGHEEGRPCAANGEDVGIVVGEEIVPGFVEGVEGETVAEEEPEDTETLMGVAEVHRASTRWNAIVIPRARARRATGDGFAIESRRSGGW